MGDRLGRPQGAVGFVTACTVLVIAVFSVYLARWGKGAGGRCVGSMAQIGLIFELFVSARGWLNLPTVTVQLCHGKVTKPILAPKTTDCVLAWPAHICRRPYHVECTGSLLTSEVKRHSARLVLGWGTAWEDLRVLSALSLHALF